MSFKKRHKQMKAEDIKKFHYDGLTVNETQCLHHVITAFNVFKSLDPEPDQFDLMEFARSLNLLERIIGMRCLRRDHPTTWSNPLPQKQEEKEEKDIKKE